jgi:monomeric isocitrate dehydrogenase
VEVLKDNIAVEAGDVVDAACLSSADLDEYVERELQAGPDRWCLWNFL